MAVIKCKMCGGDLNIIEGNSTATCEYCGSTQTVPNPNNDKKMTLFNRAGRLLRSCEFDKAEGVFESIVSEFSEEAEAYWGLVLCKYGIEYVDDPTTAKKIPTCHRSSFDCVLDDTNYEQALENTDATGRKVYRQEANAIENLRQQIIEVSGTEEPYDIFICYKETDENGNRTLDSVIAQDIYDALIKEGYRVFFSRVSLEDKLGQEYEPYIFAALNSSRIMLAVGTDYEYYTAVWVKNEWNRFLKLIAAGKEKTLIPCYKDIDAYDMPKEFAKLQAQDMGKVGAMQDLIRGIKKIMGSNHMPEDSLNHQLKQQALLQADNTVRLGIMAVNSGDLKKGSGYFEEAMKTSVDHVGVYLGLVWSLPIEQAKPFCLRLEKFPLEEVRQFLKDNPDIFLIEHAQLLTNVIRISESVELIRLLLECGANVSEPYAMYNAILSPKSRDIVSLLLQFGANPNQEYTLCYKDGHDEVHISIIDAILEAMDFEIVKLLIKHGVNVNYCIKGSNANPIQLATRINNIQMIQLLFENNADINQEYHLTDNNTTITCTVLRTAIWVSADIRIAELFIKHGADVNYSVYNNNEESWSLLNEAIRKSNEEIVGLLLDNGADPNSGRNYQKEYYNHTLGEYCHERVFYPCLSEAIWNVKNINIVRMLLEKDADPNYLRTDISQSGQRLFSKYYTEYCPALYDAILFAKNVEMVKLLLEFGADPSVEHTTTWLPYDESGFNLEYQSKSENMIELARKNGYSELAMTISNAEAKKIQDERIAEEKKLQDEKNARRKNILQEELLSLKRKYQRVNGPFSEYRQKRLQSRIDEIENELKKN